MSRLVARVATEQDAALLRNWRNDPKTRRGSRSSAPVAADKHAAWLVALLSDPSRHLWVLERDGEPVATVRHDRIRPGRYEISVTVAPHARGGGLAADALVVATAALSRRDPAPYVLEAHVQPDNAASLALFAAAGYRSAGEDGEGLVVLELPATA